MDNHFVTKHDRKAKTETIIGENLSYYEALTIVWNHRVKRDGCYYRIGKPYGLYRENEKW